MKFFVTTAIAGSIILLQQLSTVKASDPLKENLANKYRRAGSDEERLEICISAINQGVIGPGSPVKKIDGIFGTSYSKRLPPRDNGLRTGVIFVSESRESTNARALDY